MATKKTLITKISLDISQANAAQVEALKAMMKASFEASTFGVSFEIEEKKEEDLLSRLLHRVREEFKVSDQAATKSNESLSHFDELLNALTDEDDIDQ